MSYSTPYTNKPASNTDAVITVPAIAGAQVELADISWSYDVDPTGGHLQVESPLGTILKQWDVTKGGPGELVFNDGLCGAPGQAVIVTLKAATAQGTVNCTERR